MLRLFTCDCGNEVQTTDSCLECLEVELAAQLKERDAIIDEAMRLLEVLVERRLSDHLRPGCPVCSRKTKRPEESHEEGCAYAVLRARIEETRRVR